MKFIDNIIYLETMFEDCESLSSANNFQNINTKYLLTIFGLFKGCNSLLEINDISNWNTKNVNNI